jgi:hypothetical protein
MDTKTIEHFETLPECIKWSIYNQSSIDFKIADY